MNELQQTLINRTRECWDRARQLWPDFKAPYPKVEFVTGRYIGCCWGHERIGYNLAYASQGMHVVKYTVPHEVAHAVVNFFGWDRRPGAKRRSIHGPTWKRICRMLGGDGKTTCNLEAAGMTRVGSQRRVRRFEYRATCGTVLQLATATHNKIQRGQVRRLTKTNGLVARGNFTGTVKSL